MAAGNLPGVSVTAARLQIQSNTGLIDRSGRGRSGGLYDRGQVDRKPWNSDDEDFDEFGRRKKKAARKGKASSAREAASHAASASSTAPAVQTVEPPAISISPDVGWLGVDPDASGGKITTKAGLNVFCKFQAEGRCSRGVSCPFSHNPASLQSVPLDKKIKRLCKFFEVGKCTSGMACMYAHGPDELEEILAMRPRPAPQMPTAQGLQPQGMMQLPTAGPAVPTPSAEQAARLMQLKQFVQAAQPHDVLAQEVLQQHAGQEASPSALGALRRPQLSPAVAMLAEALEAAGAPQEVAGAPGTSTDERVDGPPPAAPVWSGWSGDLAGWGRW